MRINALRLQAVRLSLRRLVGPSPHRRFCCLSLLPFCVSKAPSDFFQFPVVWRPCDDVAPVPVKLRCVVSRATNERNKIAAAVDALVLSDDQNAETDAPAAAATSASSSPSSAAAAAAAAAATPSAEEAKKAEILKSIDE